MDLLGALGILVRVVETGSFSAVARERELSQAAVARQVAQLEDHFGVRLFHRTTRKLSLTDDGKMLLGLAQPVLDGVDGLEAALGRQSASPVGLVRVGVTVAASRLLAQRLPILLADHPGLKVELVVSDRLGDMIEERLDVAMRVGEIKDTSLVARRSGIAERVAAAAPSYIKQHGEPSSPADLANHTCIVHGVGPNSDVWTFATPDGQRRACGAHGRSDWIRHRLSRSVRRFRRPPQRQAGSRIERLSSAWNTVQPGLSITTAPRTTHAPCDRFHLGAVSTSPVGACNGVR
jgi:DNA-binding transcriptional LysR family regulator